MFVNIYFISNCSYGACIYIYIISWIDPLIILVCPSLSLVTVFVFKFVLSDTIIATLTFFWFLFAWNTFFHSFTFSLCVSLDLKGISCKQHIYGPYFCIHSANLHVLIEAFSPFTFKIIKYILTAILLIFGEFCFYSSFLFLLLFSSLWFNNYL